MATEISVPVRLKVLQESITSFQKILDNLQPNTKNWRDLSRLISSMTVDVQKLQAQLSKPFSSQQQFNSTEKTIDKLEEAAARVSIVMQGLKFSDIKLTPAQTQELQRFDDEINKIKESYKQLQEQVKEKLLSNTNTSNLIGGLKGNVLEKSFSEIETAVDRHINNLKNRVEEKNQQYEALLSNKRMGESATQLVTNGLGAGSIGSDIFDKFLRQTEKGLQIKSWNTGVTKQALLDAIGEMYHLEPGELQKKIEESLGKSLNQININDINKWFSEKGLKSGLFSGITQKGKRATADTPIVSQDLESLRAQLREYELIAEEIDRLKNTNITPANAQNEARVAELTGRLHELQAAIFGSSDAMNNYKSGAEQMQQANAQLRSVLQETNAEYLRQQAALNSFNAMKNTIANFMGFYQVLNLTKKAINEAANHIKELDSVMNKISIVTDMDSSDLWAQIDQYSAMAQRYGASIKGAYEVSQIYYQQGLDTADVLTLTNETLKLSKISGMDYAATTDYMTTAIRGFKMEMSEASTVVDVYSNLASNTAVSQEELAVAMSKTASSMESVGSTFEETSAMIATMVAVTRESATNIGSAMKSIASRYGELTKDPSTLLDSEGEALSFNKVDTALQSVGISMKTTTGQFRKFTDVILELGEKWDQLESTQQRYIATQFAGNRQQSRFLALVSNVDLLKENIENAENSEGIGDLQAIKALDSIENKIEQVRVAYQQFYTTIGVENVWKVFLDGAKNTINALNGMPKLFNTIPLGAIAAVSLAVSGIKKIAINGLAQIAKIIQPILSAANPSIQAAGQKTGELWIQSIIGGIKAISGQATTAGEEIGTHLQQGLLGTRNNSRYNKLEIQKWQAQITDTTTDPERLAIAGELGVRGYLNSAGMQAFAASNEAASAMLKEMYKQATLVQQRMLTLGNAVQMAGSALSILTLTLNDGSKAGKTWAAVGTLLTGVISAVGIAISTAVKIAALEVKSVDNILKTIPWYTALSAIVTIITGIVSVIRLATQSLDNEIEDANKRADELSTKAKEAQSNLKSFEQEKKKIEELEKARYDSAEAAKEYQTAVDNLAESYPQLVQNYNAAGEAVLNLQNMESLLADIRMQTAEATYAAAQAELEANKLKEKKAAGGLHTANDALGTVVHDQWWGAPEEILAYRNGTNEQISGSFLGYAGLSGDARQVFLLLEALHNAAESNNIENTITAYNELFNYLNEADLYLSQNISEAVDKIRVQALEAQGYTTNISNNSKAMVASFLNGGSGKQTANILQRSDGLSNIVSEALYDKMSKDNVEFNSENLSSYYEQLFGNLDTAYDNLSDAQLAQVNKILNNPSSYNIADITSQFSEYGIQIDDWLIEIIEQKLSSNKEALQNKIKQVEQQNVDTTAIEELINDDNISITLDERKLLNRGLDQATVLRKNGYNEQDFLSEFVNLYQGIIELPAEVRNDLITQLLDNGLTKEGLIQTKQYIEQQEIDLDMAPLMGLIELIVPNIQLTIDSIMNSLAEELEDFDSLTSNLSSGVKASKLQKTIDTAKNLGIELERSDFIADGDKFIVNYEKYKEVLSQLRSSYEEQLGVQAEEVEQAYSALGKNINDIDSARLIFGGDFDKYYEQGADGLYALKSEYDNADFQNIVTSAKENAIEAINNYNQYLNDLFAQWAKSLDWQHGDYSSLSTLGLETFKPGTEIDRIKELIYHPELLTEAEAAQPDVLNAIEQYQKGWNTVLTDLTTYGIEYIESHSALYQGLAADEITSLVNGLQSEGGETIPEAISRVAELAGKKIDEVNSTVLAWVKKNSNFGKENALSKLVSGFTLDSLESYISTNAENKDINAYVNEDGSLMGPLSEVYEWDEVTNSFQAKEGALIGNLLNAWEEATHTHIEENSDLFFQVLQDWTNEQIKLAEKNDKFTQDISTLTNAKAGQRINIQGMDSRIQQALRDSGVKIVLGYTENITQAQINAAILAAAEAAELDDSLEEWERLAAREAAEKVQASINQYDALAGVIKDTVSSSEAKTWATANNIDDARAAMSQIGYEWDENLGVYVSTADSIIALEKEIADLESADNNDATQQKVASLRAQLADLKYTSSEAGKKYQAVNGVIATPESVGNQALEQLRNAFSKETLDWTESDWNQFITDNGNGTSSINIIEFLQEVGYNTDTLFSETIAQKAQNYIQALSNAQTLASEGTTDYTEIEKFNKTIDKLVEDQYLEGGVIGETFNYDALTKTYKLTTEAWNTYIEGETKRLQALNYSPNEIKDILTKQAAENIDYESFLKSGGPIAESNLKNQLQIWLSTKYGKAADEATLQFYISSFEQGGEAALAVAQEMAADEGKELSAEEIESVYRAQVAPIKAIADSLNSLKVNSVVAKNQIQILRTAGFSVDENGVITAVGDMVAAYRSIYAQMKATGEATTAELNTAFGAYLDNRDREQAGISALQNATNMTYSQFAQIFTDAGMELTEEMFNSLTRSGIIKALGGNKMMITDFEAFARRMDWSLDSEEYINALSAYRDGIISYDKKLGDSIKANFDAISNAKVGDQINLTQLLSKFPEFEAELEAIFGDIITDGILTVHDSLTLPQLAVAVGNKAVQEGGMLAEELEAFVASIHDNILNGITTAFGYSTSGTNSITSMQAFAQEYNNLTGKNKNYSELFGYDTLFNTFKLNSTVYQEYLNAQRKQLESVGLSGEAIDEYIKDQTVTLMQQNMDIESFLNARGATAKSREANKLAAQIADWMRADGAKLTDEALLTMAEQWISQIEQGGAVAVDAIKAIKGENATTSELEAAFNNSQIVKLRTAMSDLDKGVGETVTGLAMNIMQVTDGFELAELDDGSAVITAVGDMVQAYANLYAVMKNNADATTGDLNSAYAKLLTAADQKNIDTLETLENAAGMTYEAFGEILTRYGKSFSDIMGHDFIESTGFGKIRITDFSEFARYMEFDINSPDYAEAYSAWVNSMIELQNQPKDMMQKAADELKSLSEAKPGDLINLSYLDKTLQGSLAHLVRSYGATLSDGILTLGANTDIPGLMTAIANEAAAAGQMIPEQLAEIADAIESMLSNIVSLLGNGLSGKLSNADAQTLSSWASQQGIKLDFTKTAEGLRISNEQAYQLYQKINEIDALQGQVAFQSLKENLIATKDEFKTFSSNVAYIADLEKQITELQAQEVSPDNERRLAALEEELALAKQINLERSTSTDNSFNFMSNDIPAAQKNPLNYYKNWAEAIKTLNTAMKTSAKDSSGKTHKGLIDYTDFYNIVTEMNNLAALGGDIKLGAYTLNGDLESAAKLIEAGAKALTTTKTGDIAVSLGDIGINFKAGSGDMSKGIQDGIKTMAQSQVEMLDGLIQLLETVVAMEGLSDVAGEDIELQLPEIVVEEDTADGGKAWAFTEKFDKWRNGILEALDPTKNGYNEDLAKAVDGIKIATESGTKSLKDIINMDAREWGETGEQYLPLMNAFMKAALSGNYDLDNIAESVQQELTSAGVFDQPITIDVGNTTLIFTSHGNTTIKWDTADAKAAIAAYRAQFGGDDEAAKTGIVQELEKYLSGQGTELQIETILNLQHNTLIKKRKNGTEYVIGPDGTEYEKGTKGYEAIIQETILKDQEGVDITDITTNYEAGTAVANVTYGITTKTNFKVTTDNQGNVTWTGTGPDGATYTGSNEEELLENIYRGSNNLSKDIEIKDDEFNAWIYTTYGIHRRVKAELKDSDNNVIDPANNPQLQADIRKLLKSPQEITWDPGTEPGTIIVPIGNGVTLTLNEEDVTVDGNINKEEIAKQLASQLGLDTLLSENITKGIKDAIPAIIESFTSLNATEPTGITSWSAALGAFSIAVSLASAAVQLLINNFNSLIKAIAEIPLSVDIKITVEDQAKSVIDGIAEAINNLKDKTVNITVKEKVSKSGKDDNGSDNSGLGGSAHEPGEAAGNFGLAKASGTLMGELGPEIYVQNGRYYVAGQNGPEFVDLAEDAIVFNHLQTEQLLKKGMSPTRGRAVTNERTAVAFAQGNVNGGPAMASASAALAALKQLRSMWASLAGASVQDLAGVGGGGGGGGGSPKKMAAFIKELEKWYNWLQKIAELEEKINYQEQLRSTISSSQKKNGAAYYASLKQNLNNLQEQVKTEQSLVQSQQEYFDKRRKELNTNGPFNSLYTFDENGQLKYKDGALSKLSKLNETDKYGKPKMSSQDQYDYIVNTLGIDAKYLETTATGETIDKTQDNWQATAVQAFWDKMAADQTEMQSLHDSINEHKEAVLAAQEKQNAIIQEMRDNQLAVEKDVYDAIVDSRERAIEDAEAERDAIEKSTSKFIDGLSNALDKERSMYEMQQSQNDLDQKRRRLAILQRTGGSNSEIASLQSDIASSERELYFDKQQEQIDLIQEASDKQIEKLDQQIELDKEMLEYQKEHGLLWGEVAEIMKMDSASIVDFITSNNSEWWGKSPVQSAQDLEEAIFKADNWVNFRDDQNSWYESIINAIYASTTSAAPSNPTESDDSVTHTGGTDNDNKGTVTYEQFNEKKHWKITTKKDKNGKEKESRKKEAHDFDKNGKCTKCKYKKVTNGDDNDGSKPPADGGSKPPADNGSKPPTDNGSKPPASDNKIPATDNNDPNDSAVARYEYQQEGASGHKKRAIYKSGRVGTYSKLQPHNYNGGRKCIDCGYNRHGSVAQEPGLDPEVATKDKTTKSINKESDNRTLQSLSDINLTHDELQTLRNSTLSNGLSAVNSAMKMHLAAIDNSAYTTIDRDKSTQIGSISLNMDVKQIANDYDAKRAGEKAMEEMLRIARKSTTATIRR